MEKCLCLYLGNFMEFLCPKLSKCSKYHSECWMESLKDKNSAKSQHWCEWQIFIRRLLVRLHKIGRGCTANLSVGHEDIWRWKKARKLTDEDCCLEDLLRWPVFRHSVSRHAARQPVHCFGIWRLKQDNSPPCAPNWSALCCVCTLHVVFNSIHEWDSCGRTCVVYIWPLTCADMPNQHRSMGLLFDMKNIRRQFP